MVWDTRLNVKIEKNPIIVKKYLKWDSIKIEKFLKVDPWKGYRLKKHSSIVNVASYRFHIFSNRKIINKAGLNFYYFFFLNDCYWGYLYIMKVSSYRIWNSSKSLIETADSSITNLRYKWIRGKFITHSLSSLANKNTDFEIVLSKKKIKKKKKIKFINKTLLAPLFIKIKLLLLNIKKKMLNGISILVRKKKYKIIFSDKKFTLIRTRQTLKKKKLLLNITFKKRNTFFNVSEKYGKTIYLTSIRKEGYVGRRRLEYTSIFSVMRLVRKILISYFVNKNHSLSIIYKGWSRFRNAIKKALKVKGDKFLLRISYVKYVVKIPHNGCRPPKKRCRKKCKKFFYRRKFRETTSKFKASKPRLSNISLA